jgi:hypothetical protein
MAAQARCPILSVAMALQAQLQPALAAEEEAAVALAPTMAVSVVTAWQMP